MKLIVVLYGGNCMVMPTLLGRSQVNYGRLHWNGAKRRHESQPLTIAQWQKMLPDLAESQTGERWLVDIVNAPDMSEVSAPAMPEPAAPVPAEMEAPSFTVEPQEPEPEPGRGTFRMLRKSAKLRGIEVLPTDTIETLTAKLA